MYCRNCGQEIDDRAVICVHCGSQQQPVYGQNYVEDKPSALLKLVCFFIPLVGLVLYLTMQDKQPISAKEYGKWALIGVAVRIALSIIGTIIALVFTVGITGSIFHAIDGGSFYY